MASLADQRERVHDEDADSGIRRIAAHEAAPLRPTWPEMVVLVRGQVRSLVGSTRELEDLTQATLEQILRALPRFEGRCELSTFTYSIASRVVMNHWRSIGRYLRRFVLGLDNVAEPETGGFADAETLLERERVARLHVHLEALPAEQRIVVVLCDLEELSASRIAEIVDSPEATVRSRLKRGREALAKKLLRDPLFADDARGEIS